MIDHIAFDSKTEKFYKACKKVYNRVSTVNVDEVKQELEAEESDKIDLYSLLIEEHYPDWQQRYSLKETLSQIYKAFTKHVFLDF